MAPLQKAQVQTDGTGVLFGLTGQECLLRHRRQSGEVAVDVLFVFLDCEADQSLQGAPDHTGHWRWS